MKFFRKWLVVPESNEVVEVEAIQLWEVRWQSRYDSGYRDMRPELECFTSKEAAEDFATALRNAFALVRHTTYDDVRVMKGTGGVTAPKLADMGRHVG